MSTDAPTYPSGLRLAGRRVVVVGGGHVAQRRIPALIAAEADVVVVSPEVTPAIEGLIGSGEVSWIERGFVAADLDEAWYVIAATNSQVANEAVSAAAEERRIFCVRSDDAAQATAFTPASGTYDGLSVAVVTGHVADRDPRRSAAVRDRVLTAMRAGQIDTERAEPAWSGVVLVGGGPGDPALLSQAGWDKLMQADVVVADRLAPREVLSQLPESVEIIDVAKLPRGRSALQEEINRILVDRAKAGQRVVRFKGGDSFVFGRGYEEILACRAEGVEVQTVPGLSSPFAVPARAGIPVTHRGVTHEVTVISGHLPPGHPESLVSWPSVAGLRGTVVLMMAVENAPAIAASLVDGGRDAATPVAVICDGTMPTERTVVATLGTLAERMRAEDVRPPAIIVIGEVVDVALGTDG